MAGKKNFVNNTDKDLIVILYVRNGSDPTSPTDEKVKFHLLAQSSHVQEYGNDQNIFLNGIKFSWNDDGAQLTKKQMVTTRGSWWDNVMNTNSTITWNNVGRANVVGSN